MTLNELLVLQQEVSDSYDALEQLIQKYNGKPITKMLRGVTDKRFFISLDEEVSWGNNSRRYSLYITRVFPAKTFLGYGSSPITDVMVYVYDCESSGVINDKLVLNSKQLIQKLSETRKRIQTEMAALQQDIIDGEQRWEVYNNSREGAPMIYRTFSQAFRSQKTPAFYPKKMMG